MENKKQNRKRTATRKAEVRVSYLVKTKGYKETFNSLDKAQNQFDILKKRAIKNQTPVKIQIFEKSKGKPDEIVDNVDIRDSYYDED